MDKQKLKLQLIKEILETDNRDILEKLYSTIAIGESDFLNDLTPEQREEIEISRKQIERGETESWESIY